MSGEFESTEVRSASSARTPPASAQPVRSSVGFAAAPSLPTMMRDDSVPTDPTAYQPGQQIDDFQVIALLGKGGFGAVYLAWQLSLGRQIALKVSPCIGQEGRTLARLDHPHIVRVYSETVRDQTRLLCMQYVASIPLDKLLAKLADHGDWNGEELLALIDAQHSIAAEFDPAQLADRQFLSELDHIDAVCWIGSRLADALAHAHRHGVLHRDLKPGNVLVSQYGRPLLVDFNLANITQEDGSASQVFGGTLPYMSPEHLQAFDPLDPGDQKLVTEQSDIYSLGVVLFELLTGQLPFPAHANEPTISQRLSLMVADRRQPEKIWEQTSANQTASEPAVRSVLARSMEPDPAKRWNSADEFSQALGDVLDLRATLRKVSKSSRFDKWWSVRPFLFLTILGLVPHFVGSLVNIPYNLLRVAGAQRLAVFFDLVNVYNVVVYPACVGLCVWMVWPVFQWWRQQHRESPRPRLGGEGQERGGERFTSPSQGESGPSSESSRASARPLSLTLSPEAGARGPENGLSESRLAWLRKRVLAFPYLAMYIALLGWLPGAIWFPWGLNHWAGPLTWSEIFHLQVSVAVSGLIALTYSALGVACLSICVFYPRLWTNPLHFHEQARRDVAPLRSLLRMIPFLAGAIPLVGAILSITTSEQTFSTAEYRTFKIITTGLIALGMVGFQLAVIVTGLARQAVEAFAGEEK